MGGVLDWLSIYLTADYVIRVTELGVLLPEIYYLLTYSLHGAGYSLKS
jgi:hypothetical protein